MKHNISLVFLALAILVILAICFMAIAPVLNSVAQEEYFTYLPLVSKPVDPLATPTATPTPTNTPRPTALPINTPTNTPTVTPTPTITSTPTITPTPTNTLTPTSTPTVTPTPTFTPTPQWLLFLTGFDDRKMTGLPTGSVRRSSLTDYWGNVVFPKGVFIVLFMDVVNCELTSGYVLGFDTFWMRDGSGPFYDMADLDAHFAAEHEYNRMGPYEDLQPQFVYEMVFVFDVPPQPLYSLWYRGWGSANAQRYDEGGEQ